MKRQDIKVRIERLRKKLEHVPYDRTFISYQEHAQCIWIDGRIFELEQIMMELPFDE